MKEIEIRALMPEMEEAYLDFFDHRAFSDGSPYYPCYCTAFNQRKDEIDRMREAGTEGWKEALREAASRMVREGRIRGYLAFADGIAIGWCNANDRMMYTRVGEFDLDNVPEDAPPDCRQPGQIKSIVCFEICPDYRGKGIATQLLNRVCIDAGAEGYDYVEAYPTEGALPTLAFTGPRTLYEKMGFSEYARTGDRIIMRKQLP